MFRGTSLLGGWVLALMLGSGIAMAATIPGPDSAPKVNRVLVLSTFPLDVTGFRNAIHDSLIQGAVGPIDVQNEHTGLDAHDGIAYRTSLLTLYEQKYRDLPIDVVIVVGPPALDFVLKTGFLPRVPVVTCYIPQKVVESARLQRPEITGAVHPKNVPLTLDLMLSMYPRTRRIHLIQGASVYEQAEVERARAVFSPYASRIEFDYMNDLTLEQMEARLRGIPDEDLVLYSMLTKDASGRNFSDQEPLARLARASRRPIFGLNQAYMGGGILGGVLLSQDLTARSAAELALKVLEGHRASTIPLDLDTGAVPTFDARELARWKVKDASLPPGALVLYRTPSVWELHGRTIAAGLALIGVETLLVMGLVVQLRRRRRTEQQLARAEARYRTVADFTLDCEYWQRPDGTFEYLSPSCAVVTGVQPSELVSDPGLMRQLVLKEDLPAWDQHQQAALEGRTLPLLEFRIRHRSGAVRWVEQSNNPVPEAGHGLGGTRGSLRDITSRKEGELDLKRAYSEIATLKDQLEAENTYYREKIQAQDGSSVLLGQSDPLKYLLYRIGQVAPSGTTVLIQGETGTGKELVAESIHRQGSRSDRPFVRVNCAALPPGLAESELFGHERGAFTGAQTARRGRFEVADKGTLFLDEVGELSLEIQAKLLRVLQDGSFQRVGSDRTMKADVRVIAATNRDLEQEVTAGRFREDLWYRLNVFPIAVPPLRDRRDDIPLLAQAFLSRFCQDLDRPEPALTTSVLGTLQAYPWPGNVRELQNVIHRAVLVSDLPTLRLAGPLNAGRPRPASDLQPDAQALQSIERQHILQVLEATQWKLEGPNGAAARLELKPSTLRHRMVKLGIERPVRKA